MAQKTITQITTDTPLGALVGSENFVADQGGTTKGGTLNMLSDWILGKVDSTKISDATATGKALLTAVSASSALITLGAQTALSAGATSDIVTGSSTTNVTFTPKVVHDAIVALAPVTGLVKSVNGNNPDGSGNVTLTIGTPPTLLQADATTGTATIPSLITAAVLSTTITGKLPPVASGSVNGLMTSAQFTKLAGVATGANNYTLTAATTSTLGGVQQAAFQAASVVSDITAIVNDFNALLAKLKTAGIVAAS
jgi:hypothetical protein